jgi:hypothetical protein
MTEARLEKQLYRTVRETCERYELLRDGDRIMVAMSGGKDSYTLFHILTRLVPRLPFRVELVAVHLDQVQPNYDGTGLRAYLEASGWPYEILREDTYSVVTSRLDDSATYCSLCSRLRRGTSILPPSGSVATSSRSGITATTRSRPSCSTCSTAASCRRCRRCIAPTTAGSRSSAR